MLAPRPDPAAAAALATYRHALAVKSAADELAAAARSWLLAQAAAADLPACSPAASPPQLPLEAVATRDADLPSAAAPRVEVRKHQVFDLDRANAELAQAARGRVRLLAREGQAAAARRRA